MTLKWCKLDFHITMKRREEEEEEGLISELLIELSIILDIFSTSIWGGVEHVAQMQFT